mmetsp:Transcript_71979/g.136971  ORF Transcript_71979/g.136971 Transcript_71979/m.136971 type:complete len:83 (+) Transcript_71979:149-397(+)
MGHETQGIETASAVVRAVLAIHHPLGINKIWPAHNRIRLRACARELLLGGVHAFSELCEASNRGASEYPFDNSEDTSGGYSA